MAWIESHTVLGRHRKLIELAFDLKVKPVQVIGHLHALWHAVLEQQEDGDLSKWSDSYIAQCALWEGDPTEFVTRIRERGWLDGSLVHDWIDYTGPFLIRKYSSGNPARLKDIWAKHGYKYGKGIAKYTKQKATPKRVESEQKETLPNLTFPNLSSPIPSPPFPSEPTKPEKKKKKSCDEGKPVAPAKSAETWDAYSKAYQNRYLVEPARNQKTNSLLCQLVDRLGASEAPAVAAFYLTHNSPLYVRCRHPPNMLVNDAEGLRTQWLTGKKSTTSEVKQAELQDDAREQVKRVEAMLARGL